MQKTLPPFLLIGILMITACTPQVTAAPVETQIPIAVSSTDGDQSVIRNPYTNSAFGLSFQYPFNWFGPSEYVSDETLRVEVGSDIVYPYGEPPEQPSDVKNSYSVVIQYMKNNQNSGWKDTYQSLLNLNDGESLSGARSLIIRVRQLNLGRYKGFEYIFTLPESAQTERVYGREVILLDEQTNDLLTIMGQPNNVEVGDGKEWREVYQAIEYANLASFHYIVESILLE